MDLGPFVRKELPWLRRNWRAVALVFVLAPAFLGVATTAFEQTSPRDVQLAVVPAGDDVTEDELRAVEGIAGSVGAPVAFESRDAARIALQRESVYGVLSVPHGLYDDGASATITFEVDGGMATYLQPSRAVAVVLRDRASAFPAAVSVERVVVGPERTLSEFLFAASAVGLLAVYAFTYVPAHLASERRVLERVRVESSAVSLLAAKFVLLGGLAAVALGAMALVGSALEYRTALLRPAAVGVLGLTFVALTGVSLSVTFLTRFSVAGRFLNAGLLVGVVLLSSLIYPAGFFSSTRRAIARLSPVHHAGVVARAVALEGRSAALFADRIALLAGAAVASLALLAVSVRIYERRA